MRDDKTQRVGILAFGSLIHDPGPEIGCLVIKRIKVRTPFAVEFARYSRGTRAGAPTLSPVIRGGAPVDAMILMFRHGTIFEQAADMLWRRETGNIGTGKTYPAARTPRAVRVRMLRNFAGVSEVLYTDFYQRGKIRRPNPKMLARRAIASVKDSERGRDGISYLIGVIQVGVLTPLTNDYRNEILRLTQSGSLSSALKALKRDV